MVVQNTFDVKYNFEENRMYIYKDDVKFKKLKNKYFKQPGKYDNGPRNPDNCPFNEVTYRTLRCLKLKEQRLREVKQHPITTRLLSVITCIGIGIIFIPWVIVAFFDAHVECSFFEFSQRLFNKIRPVFIERHLQQRIEKDRAELIKSITETDQLYTQSYVDTLQQKHPNYVKKYGEKTWKKHPKARKNYEDMMQIIIIAKNLLNRDISIDPKIIQEMDFVK